MNDSDFSKAKTGDKCWSIQIGDCEIYEIDTKASKSIVVKNIHRDTGWFYYVDGKANLADAGPSLFHKKPDCFKTKIKKETTLEGYFRPEAEMFCTTNYNGDMYPAQANITYEIKE